MDGLKRFRQNLSIHWLKNVKCPSRLNSLLWRSSTISPPLSQSNIVVKTTGNTQIDGEIILM